MENEIETLISDLIREKLQCPGALIADIIQNAVRVECASDAFGYLEGFYSPSLCELRVSNVKRGKLLTRPRKEHTGFKYYFNENDELALIVKTNRNIIDYVILYERQDNLTVGFLYYFSNGDISEGSELHYVIISKAENDHTTMYCATSIGCENVQEDLNIQDNMYMQSEIEEYQYDGEKVEKVIVSNKRYSCKEKALKLYIKNEIDLISKTIIFTECKFEARS